MKTKPQPLMTYAISMTWGGFTRTLPYRFAEETGKQKCQEVISSLNELLGPTFQHAMVQFPATEEDRYVITN